MSIFAQRLKELRDKLNLTQRQFGEQCQTTGAAISAYEKGQKLPSLTVATRIAQDFHVSLDWLFGLDDTAAQAKLPQTKGDFAEMIIALIDAGIPIATQIDELNVNEAVRDGVIDQVSKASYLICKEDGKKSANPVMLTILQIRDNTLATFFDGWKNLNGLRQSKTIDQELYSLWVDKQLETLKKIPLTRSPASFANDEEQ
jgi:transcriptional regulator with XRE-family HTH domain